MINENQSEWFEGDGDFTPSPKPSRFYRFKQFFLELYYASKEYYFVERFKFEVTKDENGKEKRTITESKYVKVNERTNRYELVQYPRHATVFNFWMMVLTVWALNKTKKREGFEYAAESVGDVAFIHEVQNGEPLFKRSNEPNPTISFSPVIMFGLALLLAGLITLVSYYTQ